MFFGRGADGIDKTPGKPSDLTPFAVQIGEKCEVLANIYAPNGTVLIKSGTTATGAFISKQVIIGEKVELRLESAF